MINWLKQRENNKNKETKFIIYLLEFTDFALITTNCSVFFVTNKYTSQLMNNMH